ncbi:MULTISPECIES: DUF2267 domain-containing protein [Nocardiopsis]|uniref:Putative pterin-4-alpha-carbinolamine dehydratase n=1 Tax=Nocardiopsis sinuspersici TaxID=501010 RepID=A0A1V3C6C7_9ACTN|nr:MULTISPECIES: DUF2267 domain-containing protein [Nocardiopsis]OOC56243.1 hypothetical protein NOSIN_22445 [Nocardiopsis sinuspersici]
MITYQELMDHVTQQGNVPDDEARRALEAVTGELARHADPETRDRLVEQLPTGLSKRIPAPRREAEPSTSGQLAQEVGERIGCPPERATHLTRVVLSGIHFSEPELAEALASRLPAEFAQWAEDPNGAMGRSDAGLSGTPARLDQSTLEHALGRLRGWEGDTTGLTRSVDLPRVRVTPLLNRIDRASHEIDHSYEHEFTDSGVAFTVRTASIGAVTTKDIEMAERIDEAVTAIGSGG